MKRKKRKILRILKLIIIQVLVIAVLLILGKDLYSLAGSNRADNEAPSSSPTDRPSAAIPSTDAVLNNDVFTDSEMKDLVSRNAILIGLEDQDVIFEKSSDERIYPASLTKIMTAVVSIENLKDLDQLVELPSAMFDSLYEQDASLAGFLPEETVPAIDLLYGTLLPSGAECCIGLAQYISGSEDGFVLLMNEKAKTLGMDHTHFTNTTGLHSKEHYSTVRDLALLLLYALQDDTFREIFTSSRYSTGPTKLHPDGITFYSTLFKNLSSPDFDGGSILGGKTGYTSEAGLCLASLAEKNGHEYILVTAGAAGDHTTQQFNISDALLVYEHIE